VTIIHHTLEIRPQIPENLARLNELANNLYYSWDHRTRKLFYHLDRVLWENCGHNPKVFLRRITQQRLDHAAADDAFLAEYRQTLENFDNYLQGAGHSCFGNRLNPDKDLVAYFCAEFGLHESLPVYSGGLGILAGDYCKSASDLGLPFVAIGLLYRHGNFIQTIDDTGQQFIHHTPVSPDDLLITPATTPSGEDLTVSIELPESTLTIRVWQASAGRTRLYLLDTDSEMNNPADRKITGDLYPHDRHTRLKQEIVLGIGGVRALKQLELVPTIWHINEGHPCLLLIERWCNLIDQGLGFHAAVELSAANTIFTTHTPITAGHEVYESDTLRKYLAPLLNRFGEDEKYFFELGENEHRQGFDFTGFSLRCSGFHNGVSRIHGDVAAEMEKHIWPDIPIKESPITYVTNGIHVPTFLAREWHELFNDSGWQDKLLDSDYWTHVDGIPDHVYWQTHLKLKANLIKECVRLIQKRCLRYGHGQSRLGCHTDLFRKHDDVMLIGFARRFATYKRADLLFEDMQRLQRLLGDPERPVVLLFAGKAHPNDEQGKELIHKIHALSQQPEFIGRIILLEGYDMALARKLVSSVDLWLNNPEYPMEACGTSGMKAAINGVINLSILDGWWGEGYNGSNGWAAHPHLPVHNAHLRRKMESDDLLDLLEHEIIPMYFDKTDGYSKRWVQVSKESMKSCIPQFNSDRMIMDYINKLYLPALAVADKLGNGHTSHAAELAEWKSRIKQLWPGVSLRRISEKLLGIKHGEPMHIRVAINLNGLDASDIVLECRIGNPGDDDAFNVNCCHALKFTGEHIEQEAVYEANIVPELSGLISYELRAYPYHPLLSHPLAMGRMKWI